MRRWLPFAALLAPLAAVGVRYALTPDTFKPIDPSDRAAYCASKPELEELESRLVVAYGPHARFVDEAVWLETEWLRIMRLAQWLQRCKTGGRSVVFRHGETGFLMAEFLWEDPWKYEQ